jgi:uncharacterized RDD family membrane protein YckC
MKFFCPSCNQKISADDAQAGSEALCPECGEGFEVPRSAPLEIQVPAVSPDLFVAKAGKEIGPFKKEQLAGMLNSGMIALSDSVWHKNLPEWTPVYRFLNVRPPVPESGNFAIPITTPVIRSGELASFGRRFGAAAIDGTIWVISTTLVAALLLGLLFGEGIDHISSAETDRIMWLSGAVLGWLYSAAMECSSHQATLGKMAFNLVVTRRDGSRITFWTASRRYCGKWIVPATLGIGFLPCAWTDWKQGLHDMVAGTIVVRK